eukprot:1611857-Rhodomonas_salina.5
MLQALGQMRDVFPQNQEITQYASAVTDTSTQRRGAKCYEPVPGITQACRQIAELTYAFRACRALMTCILVAT